VNGNASQFVRATQMNWHFGLLQFCRSVHVNRNKRATTGWAKNGSIYVHLIFSPNVNRFS